MSDNIEPILHVNNVSKFFSNVVALNRVNLDLYAGEVLALCGENGAGKSTLMKCIAGIQPTDEGELILFGNKVNFENAKDAQEAGIVLIFQELSLIPELSVAENIFLGRLRRTKLGLLDVKSLHREACKFLKQIECDVNSKELVRNLPIAQQQMVEIARALASDAKIIIFDEPTSSLTDKEKEVLFRNIETMKNNGAGIIYITHKMDEVFEISDRIAVFRDGAEAGSLITDRSTIDDVTQLMIGRKLDEFFHKSNASIGNESVLTVEGLTIHGIFEDVSFSVNKGEVLGLYGLVGAGRSEIVESIFGLRRLDKGKIFVNGKQAKINSSVDALKYKMGLVPEDRKEQGLILSMSCTQNIGIPQLRNFTKHFFIQSNLENQLFRQYRDKLSIQTPDGNQKCVYLSGGNQQKIVIAKWMAMCPDLLILDEPTRGIDIGSKAEIHRLIAEMAEEGLAILVISSEMPEVIGISNRVLAVSNGRIHASFTGEEITETNLIKALTGASAQRN